MKKIFSIYWTDLINLWKVPTGLFLEAVGGMLVPFGLKDVFFLFVFILACYVIALALKKPLSGYTKHVSEKAKQTKLIS
ncbi:putative membrane protein [Paenibacillus sp. yr247]|uniref:hypothetical protein n=1 Tax=Paenibacillus sp. yr247 TaxID=1761880 RepID=UPI000884D19F|nr:hypothetical protein [Paenibacillus sp. yr247]SDN41395.1 putative membrane protein [Paenibacillus sp. yr247]